MPFNIIRADITTLEYDAIVNAANSSLLGGGGVDGAIHKAAGPKLLEECKSLNGCNPGQAKITKGYNLPAKYVIHTVGPVWNGGIYGEQAVLKSCYYESLKLASEYKCESIAFPLISAGAYGYPTEDAIKIATDTIENYLKDNELNVYLCVFGHKAFAISKELKDSVQEYIDENYVETHENRRNERYRGACFSRLSPKTFKSKEVEYEETEDFGMALPNACMPSYDEFSFDLDESFTQMLFRLIDAKGMTDVQCYKKANLDRKLFSKIRSSNDYKPKKETAVALAIALELSYDETEQLLKRAGLALSTSIMFDVIVSYFIKNGVYDIFTINSTLFEYDQKTLGC